MILKTHLWWAQIDAAHINKHVIQLKMNMSELKTRKSRNYVVRNICPRQKFVAAKDI